MGDYSISLKCDRDGDVNRTVTNGIRFDFVVVPLEGFKMGRRCGCGSWVRVVGVVWVVRQ